MSGYCGSASLQTVALYYGNWLSQDAVRGTTGGHDGRHELLLGDGGCCASAAIAAQLRLNVTQWPHAKVPAPQHAAFVDWMTTAIDASEPVVFGVCAVRAMQPHISPADVWSGTPVTQCRAQ